MKGRGNRWNRARRGKVSQAKKQHLTSPWNLSTGDAEYGETAVEVGGVVAEYGVTAAYVVAVCGVTGSLESLAGLGPATVYFLS